MEGARQPAAGRRVLAAADPGHAGLPRFRSRLKRNFPPESFLIVRYGDHQPDFASLLLEPGIDDATIAKRIATFDPRYFTTYSAIDAINYRPVDTSDALDTIEGPY